MEPQTFSGRNSRSWWRDRGTSDFWLSVLFPESLACPEASGHWKGSKLQDWHHWRMEISFQLSKLTVPAIFNPTPVPPNLEDVSKPLVPKDSLLHAFLACLHFCYGSDHILSYLLFHTIGNRRLWSWLCIPRLISKSSLLLSALTLIASHQSLTLAVSLVLVISWNHSPLYTCTAVSESRPPLGLAFIMTTI